MTKGTEGKLIALRQNTEPRFAEAAKILRDLLRSGAIPKSFGEAGRMLRMSGLSARKRV